MTAPSTPDPAALTPARIVQELDRYVVGQRDAKRAVAVAIRNRWRRLRLGPDLREEVLPKNILLIGPTGVGKTEIARRIAGLIGAPFLKVEATKFTEVGYVGRDVEQIVRDLLDGAMAMVRAERRKTVEDRARERAEERVLDALVASWRPGDAGADPFGFTHVGGTGGEDASALRVKLRERLRAGGLADREVPVEVKEAPPGLDLFGQASFAQTGIDLQSLMERLNPSKRKTRRMKVPEALEALAAEEAEGMVDREDVATEAIHRVESGGIVFLDEIDKIAGGGGGRQGPDVSREGVQRDLLPLVEGTTVTTRHGVVRTEHVLFIGAGAFHMSKPSDLLPELQGRFPIRVRLEALTEQDFVRILEEPKNALTKQYEALLATEGVRLSFAKDGVAEIARVAARANAQFENIGARRLGTILERVLEEVSFDAPSRAGTEILVDRAYVQSRVADLLADQDLGRYVL
jgi:ATP-dependent HslUV protease ATP-binding subunit HslU